MTSLVGILLLAPLLVVLIGIYQHAATRSTRTPARQRFDRLALIAAALLTMTTAWFAVDLAPPGKGPIWPHVYAALAGFFSMLLALGLAWWARRFV